MFYLNTSVTPILASLRGGPKEILHCVQDRLRNLPSSFRGSEATEGISTRDCFAALQPVGVFSFLVILRRSRRISHARKEEILRLRLRMTRNTPTGWLRMTITSLRGAEGDEA